MTHGAPEVMRLSFRPDRTMRTAWALISFTHYRAIPIMPKDDKVTRLSTVSAHIEAGYVHLPKHAPWLDEFVLEILQFPNSRHDDQVDSMTQFLSWVRERRRAVIRVYKLKGF